MRRTLFLPAFTLTLAAQAPTVLNAPIQKVRVHPDEAWVTRTAKTRLSNSGIHKLKFSQLPGGLTLDDLRIQAKGPEGTRLGEILVGPDRHIVPETPESKSLLAKLEGLQQRKNLLTGQQQAATKAQEFLDQFQSSLRSDAGRPLPSATQLLDLNRGLEGRVAELAAQSEWRAKDLERLEKEMHELEGKWQKLRGELDTNPNPSQVTAELNLPQSGEVEVELSYRTRQARWKPAYEARLSSNGQSMELVLFASVTQSSGESWENVQIELSNSQPSRVQELPQFKAFPKLAWKAPLPMPVATAVVEVVGYSASVDKTESRSAANFASDLSGPRYTPPAPKPMPALEPGAPVLEEAKGLARTWSLEGAKVVPSDGDAHRFRVLDESIKPTLQLVVAPRLDTTPIQVVRFEAPGRIPLFPGAPISRSVGSIRLGQGILQIPPANQPFELSFGPYEGVRASFQKLSERTPFRMTKLHTVQQSDGRQTRQFTKEEVLANDPNPRWEIQERISLANDSSEELTVEVLDRAVQTQHESVTVEPLEGATPPTREVSPGVNAWLVRIPAKGHAQVDLGWSIRAPKEGELLGLRELGFN